MRNLQKTVFSQMILYQQVKERCEKAGTNAAYTTAIFTGSFFLTGGMYSIRA